MIAIPWNSSHGQRVLQAGVRVLFLLATSTYLGVCSDIRTVGGVNVDLQSIHDWKQSGRGERPMPHWKDVQLLQLERMSAYPQVLVIVEGRQTSILIRNCPRHLLKVLGDKNALETQLSAARKKTALLVSDVEYAATRSRSIFVAHGNDEYLDAAAREYYARREDLANAKASLARAAADEEEINRKLVQAEKVIQSEGALLAMNTGQTQGNLPVWDTGLKPGL